MPERRIEHLAHALDAAAESLRIAPSNEARYNRALALQGLAAFVGDAAPWDEYLAIETESAWQAAARHWMTRAQPAVDSREEWTRRLDQLRKRLSQRDRAYLEETARLFPEATLEFFEQEVLPAWARAVLNREGFDDRRRRCERHSDGRSDSRRNKRPRAARCGGCDTNSPSRVGGRPPRLQRWGEAFRHKCLCRCDEGVRTRTRWIRTREKP